MTTKEVIIPIHGVSLQGELEFPAGAASLVVFAHGSGSSRNSPRNQYVARVIRQAGCGTLLFDLLTPEEEETEAHTRHLRFDIPFLANRLRAATAWVLGQAGSNKINTGYFGSSTG